MALTLDGDNGISGINGSATTPAVQGTDTNTGLTFGTDTVGVVTGGTTRTTVDSSGRLLVGTSAISSPKCDASGIDLSNGNLTVVGGADSTLLTRTDSTRKDMRIGCVHYTNAEEPVIGLNFVVDGSESAVMYGGGTGLGNAATRLQFYTAANQTTTTGTERARITSSGHFKATNSGDYFASGAAVHELRNSTGNNEIAFLSHTASSGPYGINIRYTNAAPNGSDNFFFYARDSSALRAQITSNGGLQNYQSNNVNLCDEREKKNIVDLDSTWDCLKHWELKKFHYNEDADTDDKRYGVIAQQVAPHCPEVITEWVKQRAEDAVLDDDGKVVTPAAEEIVRMGVKEQQMMWMAIRALQEAQTRIEQLETRVAQLEGGAA